MLSSGLKSCTLHFLDDQLHTLICRTAKYSHLHWCQRDLHTKQVKRFERSTYEELDPPCLLSKNQGEFVTWLPGECHCPHGTVMLPSWQNRIKPSAMQSVLQKTLQGQFEQGSTSIYSKEGPEATK